MLENIMQRVRQLVQNRNALIALVVAVSVGSSIFFFAKYQRVKHSAVVANPGEAKDLVDVLSRFMVLPDELPTIATVTDKTRLDRQDFYKNAENGDKVIIFEGARRAILYRPSTKKIIDFTIINTSQQAAQTLGAAQGQNPTPPSPTAATTETPTPPKTQTLRLALYNGTKTNGLTKVAEEDLKDKLPNIEFEVVARDNAQGEYDRTAVVDLTGDNANSIEQIAKVIGADVADLPPDETEPDADILIILGTSYVE